MKTNLTITAAGKAALTAAGVAGADAVEITGIAVGLAPRVLPDITGVTALQSEITRTDFRGDAGASPGSIAGYGLFEGAAVWTALEIGVYARVGAADEILFAYALAVANTSDVRVPLLTKTAGEPARYDFAFIFSPSSDVALSPCSAPSPSPCSVPSSCFVPPYYYAPPPPAPVKREIWRSINKRPPHADDVAHPVGHVWMQGKNEWVLESISNGEAQWRQTRGGLLIYNNTTPPTANGQVNLQISILGSASIGDYASLNFYAAITDTNVQNAFSITSPVHIDTVAFVAGEDAHMTRVGGGSNRFYDIIIRYVNPREILFLQENPRLIYVNKIYGVY